MATLDPATLKWTEVGSKGKSDFNAEEGWTLMPDGSVLTYDVRHAPHSERYIPAKQEWVSAGSTRSSTCTRHTKARVFPTEAVATLLPARLDLESFVLTGRFRHWRLLGFRKRARAYGDLLSSDGKWTAGPDFPNGDAAGDSYAVLLPSGHVLVAGLSGALYEWDGTKLTDEPVGGVAPLLILPTGETICIGSYVALYTSPGKPSASWAPVITTYPHTVTHAARTRFPAKQFNGLSQAAAFGDGVSDRYQLSPGTGHEQTPPSTFLLQNARSQHHGVATGSRDRFYSL